MNNTGRIIFAIAISLGFFTLLPIPFWLYILFGLVCSIFFYINLVRHVRRQYDCTIGEYILVISPEQQALLDTIEKATLIHSLNVITVTFTFFSYLLLWPGIALCDIGDVVIKGVFYPNSAPMSRAEFDAIKKKLLESINSFVLGVGQETETDTSM